MQRGDLQTTPLADLLEQLADATATGCVYLLPPGSRSDSDESMVGLRNGTIWTVTVPGSEESIATRLVSSRQLSPTSLAEAREAQNTELSNWMLADLLIHLGLADEQDVHDFVAERALSDLADLCGWQSGSWRFRRRQRWGANLRSPLQVSDALATVAERRAEWRELLPVIRGPQAVVSLAAHPSEASFEGDTAADTAVEMDADGFALLCIVDGEKTVAELGDAAGFTLLDAGRTIAKLVDAGLVQVTLDSSAAAGELDAIAELREGAHDDVGPAERHSLDAIAAALTFDDSWLTGSCAGDPGPVGAPWQAPRTSQGDPLTDALARVSAALSEAMSSQEGEPNEDDITGEVIDETSNEDVERERDLEEVDEAGDFAVAAGGSLDDLAAFAATLPEEELDDDPAEPVNDSLYSVDLALDITDSEEFVDVPMIELEAYVEPRTEPEAESEVESEVEVEVEVEVEPVAEAIDSDSDSESDSDSDPAPAALVRPRSTASHYDMADASRLLSQLAGEALPTPVAVAAEPEEAEPEPVAVEAAPVGYAPAPRRENGLADTAALLRELSSLGIENTTAPRPAPSRPQAPAAPVAGQHSRKRKGLFGRS